MSINRRFTAAIFGLAFWALTPADSAWADDDARGAKLFGLCTQCHGSDGAGVEAYLAPSIAGMDAWYVENQLKKFRSGIRGTHPKDVGGLRMGPMSRAIRSDTDVALLATHIANMPAAMPDPVLKGGNVTSGKALYATCMACHGPDAAGNQAMGSGPLRYSSDWYLFSSLHKFKSGVRGSAPGDQTGAMMRPMAAMLTSEQAMKDVIAYIMTLRNENERSVSLP